MNTKTFAQQARNILLKGVSQKLMYWGFTKNGETTEQPTAVSGGYLFRAKVFNDARVPALWAALAKAVANKGIDQVMEEAAYTWFNRIMALRILVKNGYEDAQLIDAEGLEHYPVILQNARQGNYAFLNQNEQSRLSKILNDYEKDQEAFAILLKGYCHNHKTLNSVFGKIDDYTELLLPDNILQADGFLYLLNSTDAISDKDYQKVELIGWLYQFYISEKKDDVFASFKKGKKAEAKDIPAATQIFTPNWIVKYMVENTAGKTWLDKHPNSALKKQMKYLVTNDSDAKATPIINNVEELTLIDPAAGSGHILVEGFDLIYKMYMEEYYEPEEAVASIFKNNLFGLDIDDRAAQLATFAILLKTAKVYPAIWTKDWLPNVYAMPEAVAFNPEEIQDFLGEEGLDYTAELETALNLMQQAKNLGSVMQLTLSEEAKSYIALRFDEIKNTEFREFNIEISFTKLKNYIPVLLLLTKKYTSVVANPPYMGQKNMNTDLKAYVNKNYPLSKADLFAVFMESTLAMNIDNGLMGMINQHSWMFLTTYKKLRIKILNKYSIMNMLHLGKKTFEELNGDVVQSTAFVLKNTSDLEKGTYYRLVNYRTIHEKQKYFLKRSDEFINIPKINFFKIPNTPIAYWATDYVLSIYQNFPSINSFSRVKTGLQTGSNDTFLRHWYEVDQSKTSLTNGCKWFPYNKGGGDRKWYGQNELLINWQNNGKKIREHKSSVIRNKDFYFIPGYTWSTISNSRIAFRKFDKGFLFDTKGSCVFPDEGNKILPYINSNTFNFFLTIQSPTLDYSVGNISNVPYKENSYDFDTSIPVEISQYDWDSRELSWDFKQSRIINKGNTLESSYNLWLSTASENFFRLLVLEEELNRIFIDIYGLQDELTPDVALKDITILQEELAKNDLEALEENFRANGKDAISLPINKAEVISQFISYAIGLFMGRYRLDKPGLNIAHPKPNTEELASYSYNNGEVSIDEDAILPLMGSGCSFPDDVLQQFYSLLDTLWGAETRTENINFIQACLNSDLDKFLVKSFYKYHCKMYKKKPIYWLFSSKKGAFQVLVYMHRMNAFTVEKIRANYLMPHIKAMETELSTLESNTASLSTKEAKSLEKTRKNLQECYDYDKDLKDIADKQISFDLDDGVSVNYKKFESVVAKIK